MSAKRARTIDGTVVRVTPITMHVVIPGSVSTAVCGQAPESTKAAIHVLTSPLLFGHTKGVKCPDCMEWLHA